MQRSLGQRRWSAPDGPALGNVGGAPIALVRLPRLPGEYRRQCHLGGPQARKFYLLDLAGYAQARAFAEVEVETDTAKEIVTVWGQPFSLG
ncbi:MspA family porin [Nocardia farcinica]|uniref:MspA family porin n=1 Tax=Nocardia farcinica TaxID=37329 RepID=UPI00313A794F